jgi:Heavy metal associated domain 2
MEHGIERYGTVHALPGRVRIRVAAIKKAPELALQVEQTLREEPGVAEAVANPVTGSVLVHYDPTRTAPAAVLARLEPYGLSLTSPVSSSLADFSNQLGKAVGKELVKFALTQMLPGGPVEVLFALI